LPAGVDPANDFDVSQSFPFPSKLDAWVGPFEYFERAKTRLRVVALLLYSNTRSSVETAMVMLAAPFRWSARSGSSSRSATTCRSPCRCSGARTPAPT
jgi:hypothetical protein